jgi:hypothetical protein
MTGERPSHLRLVADSSRPEVETFGFSLNLRRGREYPFRTPELRLTRKQLLALARAIDKIEVAR